MPKKMSSTSSDSSSDDDLAKFQSVAVTFEDITSNAKEVQEKAKKRISGRKRKAEKRGDEGGEDGHIGAGGGAASDDDDEGPLDYLTPVQLKVAAALNGLLEGRLRHKEPKPKRLKKKAKAAAKAEAVAAAEAGGDGGFRFFPRVAAGTEVVLEPEEQPLPQGTPFPEQFRERRAPATWEAAAALPALAADGAALLAAALAAAAKHAAAVGARAPVLCSMCGACVGGTGGAAGAASGAAQGKKSKKEKGGAAEPAFKPGRKLGEGVVVEAKPAVPYDVRMQRLVGTPGSSCPP